MSKHEPPRKWHGVNPSFSPHKNIQNTDLCQHNAPLVGKLILDQDSGPKMVWKRRLLLNMAIFGYVWYLCFNLWVVMVFIFKGTTFRMAWAYRHFLEGCQKIVVETSPKWSHWVPWDTDSIWIITFEAKFGHVGRPTVVASESNEFPP